MAQAQAYHARTVEPASCSQLRLQTCRRGCSSSHPMLVSIPSRCRSASSTLTTIFATRSESGRARSISCSGGKTVQTSCAWPPSSTPSSSPSRLSAATTPLTCSWCA